MLTHGSLFSGIGGFDLAAEWMGWQNTFHCEWNTFGQRILKYYWPGAASHGDITKTNFTKYANTINILSGGFPCQPFSTAGNRKGTNDDRYLWPEYLRAVREIKPVAVVGENVTGILSMEEREVFARVDSRSIIRFDYIDQYEAVYTRQADMLVNRIIKDLENEGYKVQIFAIPAAGIGAPHKRERIWFVAHSDSRRARSIGKNYEKDGTEKIYSSRTKNNTFISIGNVSERTSSNSNVKRIQGRTTSRYFSKIGEIGDQLTRGYYKPNHWKMFPTQSPICDGNDGISSRLDGTSFHKWRNESIKAGGNAIVPQVAYQIFKAIEKNGNR